MVLAYHLWTHLRVQGVQVLEELKQMGFEVIVDEARVQPGWVLKRARVPVWVLALRSRV
jgi:hypothetical protein